MTYLQRNRVTTWLVLMGLIGGSLLAGHHWLERNASGQQSSASEVLSSDQLAKIELISSAFREVSRRVKPAVVHIVTTANPAEESDRSPWGNIDPESIPEEFRKYFDRFQENQRRLPQRPRLGSGSGVIVDAEEGIIMTNNHVVEDADDGQGRVDIRLFDGRRYRAEILGRDGKTDLAVLKINADNLTAIPIGDSEEIEVGDWVLAIGAPFGYDQTVTQGIISAKGRTQVLGIGYEHLLQTDAAINPGNSGGPLVNMRGELVGINTAIATSSLMRGYMGIGFAIPTSTVKEVLPDLREGREVVRGSIGVSIRALDSFQPGIGKSFGLDGDRGILIEGVKPDSPAERAGLQMDDIILKYGGERVDDIQVLQSMVAHTKPGTKVDIVVWRDGKEMTIPVTVEKQPEDFFERGFGLGGWDGEGGTEGAEETVSIDLLGMTAATATAESAKEYGWTAEADYKGKLLVTKVEPLGEARAQGIRAGDLIISVQGVSVSSARELRNALGDEALSTGVRIRIRSLTAGYRLIYIPPIKK